MTETPRISLSIVSHAQADLIANLLADLRSTCGATFEILLRFNIPEDTSFLETFRDLPIRQFHNESPRGFGANHNASFQQARGEIFAVVNPDIRASDFDFTSILSIASRPEIGACAPRIINSAGKTEDSFRRFPTINRLLRRLVLRQRSPDYDLRGQVELRVDWVAGMFIALRRDVYSRINGFDDRYFMYMEDADICRRIRRIGLEVVVDCTSVLIHDAQRASRRSLRHLAWHLRSAIRFLTGF